MNPGDPLFKKIEAELGKGDADAVLRVANNPKLRPYVMLLPLALTGDEGAQAALSIGAILAGKEPVGTLPPHLTVFLAALQLTLVKNPDLTSTTKSRPKVLGLPEMLEEVAAAKEAPTTNLPMLRTPPATLREQAAHIRLLRIVVKHMGFTVSNIAANLTEAERDAHDQVKQEYDLARPYALANAALRARLEFTEGYFYDPAKQAAETAKANKAQQDKRVERETLKATERADGAASARMANRLRALVAQIEDATDQDEDEPTPPSKSTRKTPR